jgi:hypothetical protein
MKTTIIKKAKMLVITGWTCLLAAFVFTTASGQNDCKTDQYLKALPAGLELLEKNPQRYLMTAIYYNKDIYGKFFDKTKVAGEYTRGLEDGYVKWNNVTIATSTEENGIFPEGKKMEYMEDFRYKPLKDMVKESAFSAFPPNNPYDIQTKNLVWDMMGIEAFAWVYYDSLKLNQNYAPKDINGKVDLAGSGYFENKHIILNWSGITRLNGEVCAIIQFLAMDNPLEFNSEINGMQITVKGRSHYWGNVLISLEDKQIEQVRMYEDVVMKVNIPAIQNEMISNATREITVDKLN